MLRSRMVPIWTLFSEKLRITDYEVFMLFVYADLVHVLLEGGEFGSVLSDRAAAV